jgi:hypothetical protein
VAARFTIVRLTPSARRYFNQPELTAEALDAPTGGHRYGWFHTGDIGIGSACEVLANCSLSEGQVPRDGESSGGAQEMNLSVGDVVTVSEIKGTRCHVEPGRGWCELSALRWKPERTSAGIDAKFLKICGAFAPRVLSRRVPTRAQSETWLLAGLRVRSHCRFRNRGTEYASEYGMKWMSGCTKRQCDRALAGLRNVRAQGGRSGR